MKYANLKSLINNSSSSRQYFLSLPVDRQLELHKYNDYIFTLERLHYYTSLVYPLKRNPIK